MRAFQAVVHEFALGDEKDGRAGNRAAQKHAFAGNERKEERAEHKQHYRNNTVPNIYFAVYTQGGCD